VRSCLVNWFVCHLPQFLMSQCFSKVAALCCGKVAALCFRNVAAMCCSNVAAFIVLQVDEQISEKLFGQLVRLPPTSLVVDVKELGYENGAIAVMDLVRQYQVTFACRLL